MGISVDHHTRYRVITTHGRLVLLVVFSLIVIQNLCAERIVEAGETIGHFDFFRHTHDQSKRTFSQNVGRVAGGALLGNGDVAFFLSDERTPREFNSTVFVIRIDPANPDAFSIISGPHTPLYSQNESLSFVAGPTLYGENSYAFIGYWQEIDFNANPQVKHHYYIMVAPRTGGEALILFELPDQPPGHPGIYGDIVYLAADGFEPDAFMLGLYGQAGTRGEFQLYSAQGSYMRTIHYPDLYLNISPLNHCFHDSSLSLAANGDLLAVRSDDRDNSSTCPSWINLSCIRFDRYGNYKGAWDFGRSLTHAPWSPGSGTSLIIELANGDFLSSHRFADFDIRDNDSNGTTYRNYVLRPKSPFGQPKCRVKPDSQWISTLVKSEPAVGSIRISNTGTALLQVHDVLREGDDSALFEISGNTSFDLEPGFGLSDKSGTFTDLEIEFSPLLAGNISIQVEVHSNDPENPVQSVNVKGIGLPEDYFDAVVLESGILDPLPHEVKGLTLSPDEGTGSILIRVQPGGGDPYVKILSVPTIRDQDNRITGFDVNSISNLLDHLPESVLWMKLDDAGMMWYGPVVIEVDTSRLVPVTKWGVIQRKPDGSEFGQLLQYLETSPTFDADFIPDKSAVIFALKGSRAPLRYDLALREDGFYDLAFRRPLNACVTVGVLSSLTVIPHPHQELLLVHSNDPKETILYRGWTDDFWLNEEDPPLLDSFTFSTTTPVGQIIPDLLTTDFAYVDFANQIHRLTGPMSMVPIDLTRLPMVKDISFYGDWIILEWDPAEVPLAIEGSPDLVNWTRIVKPSFNTKRILKPVEIEGMVFFRLVSD